MSGRWFVSGRSRVRLAWTALVLVVVASGVVWAVLDALREPSVPSIVLAAILASLAAGAVVLAGEAFGSGFVRLTADGYRAPLGALRRWADVLAIGSASVEGRRVPAVALRAWPEKASGTSGVSRFPEFPVVMDTFVGFTEAEGDALAAEFAARAPGAPGEFSSIVLPPSWWAAVDTEAARVREAVAAASGRHPVAEARVELGYPGLASALLLDYGDNDAGEQVQVLVRLASDLALVVDGVRFLRQARKRTPDAAAEVEALFGPHGTELLPATDLALAQAVVTVEGRRPLRFNAEEPDRF